MDVADAKAARRRSARRARQALLPEVRDAAEARVATLLLEFAAAQQAGAVGVYCAAGSELSLAPFATAFRAAGGRTAYPRVAAGGQLEFALVADEAALVAGYRGLREPPPGAPAVALGGLDLLLVPGLAFDDDGGRLGQGGGFYDRLLAAPARPAWVLGVAFAAQGGARVPSAPHDQRVDGVVTEHGIALMRRGSR